MSVTGGPDGSQELPRDSRVLGAARARERDARPRDDVDDPAHTIFFLYCSQIYLYGVLGLFCQLIRLRLIHARRSRYHPCVSVDTYISPNPTDVLREQLSGRPCVTHSGDK